MATTPHGRADCKQAAGLAGLAMSQTMFVSIYKALKALEARSLMTEVSCSWGNGTGFNYPDQASPIGTSGHVMMKMPETLARPHDVYVLVQLESSTIARCKVNGSNPSAYGSIGIVFASALDSGGGFAVPFRTTGSAGTFFGTDCDGADEIPTCDAGGKEKFVCPSGGKLWVSCRSNNTGGSFATYKNDMMLLSTPAATAAATRWYIMCDSDSIAFVADKGDDGTDSVVANVLFTPDTNIAATIKFNTFAFRSSLSAPANYLETLIGTTAGTAADEICVPYAAAGDGKIGSMWTGIAKQTAYHPSTISSEYSDGALDLGVVDGAVYGVAGAVDSFLGVTCGLKAYDTLATKSRLVIGGTSATDAKLTLPHDGTTTPQTAGSTRDGVDW